MSTTAHRHKTSRTFTLMDVVVAAKRETFRAKAESSAFLHLVAGQWELSDLENELRRYAAEHLSDWLSAVEIERTISEAIQSARDALVADQ
jgi:hypothetical protein